MKQFLFALLHHAGVFRVFSWRNRTRPTILSYHSVLESAHPLANDPHKQHIPLPLFRQHLDYLVRHYSVISLAELVDAGISNRPLPNNSVVLTFEDGFRDFHSAAAPELEQRGLPATVFVITDFVGGVPGPNGESFLSWDMIRDLSHRGFEVGSHTCSHPNLTEIPLAEVTNQLARSLEEIRDNLNHNHISLSYPYSCTSEAICRLAREVGYYCAVGDTAEGMISDIRELFALSRVTIASDDNVPALAARVSGFASWARRIFRVQTSAPHTKARSDCRPAQSDACPRVPISS